jgi:hypothetical protein
MEKLSRTIGVEMEGYVTDNPSESGMIEEMTAYNCGVGHDESLANTYWDYEGEPCGVEVRTDPINDISILRPIIDTLKAYGWNTTDSAGTHIHVDISDYTQKDMAKLIRFGKGIERIIFTLIEDYRYSNRYCVKIEKEWRKIFWAKSRISKELNWEQIERIGLEDYLDQRELDDNLWNGKYQWLNVLGSRYSTAEFRLFHAVKDAEGVIKQAQLAYNIVELVKNSSVEQLEFIIKALYEQPTAESAVAKFFEVLGMEPMEMIGARAENYLKRKLEQTVDSSVVAVV